MTGSSGSNSGLYKEVHIELQHQSVGLVWVLPHLLYLLTRISLQENVNFIKGWIMFYGLISDMLGSEEMPVIVPTARSVRIAAEVLIEREQSGIASANAKYFSAYLSQGGR